MKTNYLKEFNLLDPNLILESKKTFEQYRKSFDYFEFKLLGETIFLRKELLNEDQFLFIEKEIKNHEYYNYIDNIFPLLENIEINNTLHLDKIKCSTKLIDLLQKDWDTNVKFFSNEATSKAIKGILDFKKAFKEKYLKTFSDEQKPLLTLEEIINYHSMINNKKHLREEENKGFRKENFDLDGLTMEYSPWKDTIDFNLIEKEMKKLVDFSNNKIKENIKEEKWHGLSENSKNEKIMFDNAPYLKSSLINFYFIKIHPFLNANGRMGRILDQIVFYINKKDLTKEMFLWYSNTISIFIKKTNIDFVKSLEYTHQTKDLSYFIAYFKSLKLSIMKSLLFVLNTLKDVNSWKLALITFFIHLNDGTMVLSTLREQYGFDIETESSAYKMLSKLEKKGIITSLKVSKERIYTIKNKNILFK